MAMLEYDCRDHRAPAISFRLNRNRQMLARLADWSSVVGAVLGAAGLVFSILAFRAASLARQSAEEARRDVRTLGAAEKLQHLSVIASELSTHVQLDNLLVATFLAKELAREISAAIVRWDFLGDQTKLKFGQASRAAMKVGEFVRSKNQLDLGDKAIVLKKCDLILIVLSGESGKIQGKLEGG